MRNSAAGLTVTDRPAGMAAGLVMDKEPATTFTSPPKLLAPPSTTVFGLVFWMPPAPVTDPLSESVLLAPKKNTVLENVSALVRVMSWVEYSEIDGGARPSLAKLIGEPWIVYADV